MERVNTIMERLGFRKEADEGTKAAFVKNLIKQAYGVEVPLPPQYAAQQKQTIEQFSEAILGGGKKAELEKPAQLSFDFGDKTEAG